MTQDRLRNGAHDAAQRIREAANGVLGSARARVGDSAHHAADRAEDAYDAALASLAGTARERPFMALALALGIGFIAGVLAVRR
jgi:ElaB/YqjD/DUF883 family membrane-anchored ribosome-binding protein